jgi:hypothetical protein
METRTTSSIPGIANRITAIKWELVTRQLHNKGFVIVKDVLNQQECDKLIAEYDTGNYRKTVNMDRYRYGSGEYKYYDYPLPAVINQLRESVYPNIAPVANAWMQELGIDKTFPLTHPEMKKLSHDNGQLKPTARVLKYGQGGFNTMHQDLYGEVYFPMQMVFVLNQANEDFTGGEFVITEQIPRAQSKANVLVPDKGDMVIFTTNFRSAKGINGYHRVNMKHGVSPLHSGNRHSLGIIFHDALS